jgi:hypothetical protein
MTPIAGLALSSVLKSLTGAATPSRLHPASIAQASASWAAHCT